MVKFVSNSEINTDQLESTSNVGLPGGVRGSLLNFKEK